MSRGARSTLEINARQFTADAPNQRWVGDTTEFIIGESGKLYLAAILDLFSRFQTILEARGMTCSMSRRGNCYDHAVMEAFFSSVKSELGEHFERCGTGKMQLFDYIEVFYNQFQGGGAIRFRRLAPDSRRA